MEDSLEVTVPRFSDSSGDEIVVEFRAYAKDEEAPEIILKTLRSDLVTLLFHVIQDYPELYDKPIIYT